MRFVSFLLLTLFAQASSALADEPEFRSDLIRQNPEHFLEQALASPAEGSSSYWLELAFAHLRLSQREPALNSIERAIGLASLLDDHPLHQARLYHTKAEIYGRLYRNTDLGIEALLQAVQWLEPLQHDQARLLKTEVYESLAQAYLQQSNYQAAIHYAEKSLQQANNPGQQLNSHFLLGRLLLQLNRVAEAFAHFNQSLQLATELEAEHAFPLIQLRYGMGYQRLGLPDQALAAFHQARQGFLQHSMERPYINSLLRIAAVELEQSQPDPELESSLLEALQRSRQLNDNYLISKSKLHLATWAQQQQQLDRSEQLLRQALVLTTQMGNRELTHRTQLSLADLMLTQDNIEQAQQQLQLMQMDATDTNQAMHIRYRYSELAAELAAQSQNWQQAYHYSQLARALRFEELQEQYRLRLDYFQPSSPEGPTQPQQTANYWLVWLLASISLLLAITVLWSRRQVKALQRQRSPAQLVYSQQWGQFSDKLTAHQRQKLPLHLMAITVRGCQDYKQRHGELQLRQALVSLLQYMKMPEVIQLTIHSDVLWLGLQCSEAQAAEVEQAILLHLLQQRKQLQPAPLLQSLLLPLHPLLGDNFAASHLQALREAVWLSWHLAEQLCHRDKHLHLQLKVQENSPCEWLTENPRQDLLNALQLGSIELWQQDRLLNPAITELLD